MEYLNQQEKMDCMAGTAILKKQSTTNNITSKATNLNTTLKHSNILVPSPISCCLWLQQPQVVESNNSKCNSNDRSMKENSTNNCSSSSSCSCCTLDDRILTNCNYRIETLRKKQPTTKQRPLTLNALAVVIIMSLSILLIQMPAMVQSKSFQGESAEDAVAVAETSAKLKEKLLLSLLAETEAEAEAQPSSSSSSSSLTYRTWHMAKHLQPHIHRHQRERGMRLRKRHTGDLIITKYLHENGHNLEWKNPCNVYHVNMETEARHVTKQQVYQYLKKFERDVGMEYEFISATANSIAINDMSDWSKHDEIYKFLPKLNANGSIALSRWYRNMQVYVASFGYLARTQYKYDQHKRMFVGRTSDELNKLLSSARFILCELETAINGSAPNNNLKKLRTISRRAMNKRLNFVTKHQLAHGNHNDDIVPANIVDLKFAKYSYYQYLLNLQEILNNKLESKSKKYGLMESREDKSNNQVVGADETSSLDFSSIFKSDSSLSLGESVEILLKTTKRPHTQRRRSHKSKNSPSTEV